MALNQALCSRKSNVAHGCNPATIEKVRNAWKQAQTQEMSVLELMQFLYQCHKSAPFLNFNGNVFAEIARQLLSSSLLGMPISRLEVAISLAAHYVAGVIDQDIALDGIVALLTVDLLEPGDRVATLEMTTKGKVTRVLPDGRVAWLPDGRKNELCAAPETLIKLHA